MRNLFRRKTLGRLIHRTKVAQRTKPVQVRNCYHEAQDYIKKVTAQDPPGVYDRAMELWNCRPSLAPDQYVRQARDELAGKKVIE